MRWREFIVMLGGATAAWPLAARAQQPPKLPVIGFLGPNTASAQRQWTDAFVQRLRELGWIEGRDIVIEYRWAEGRIERFAEIATELVALKVNVIVTAGGAVPAVKQATSVIPIVFSVANNPVGSGYVASLARPGGNITGLSVQSTDLIGKRLELLREVTPGLRQLAIIGTSGNPSVVLEMSEVQSTARTLGIEVTNIEIARRRISRPPSGCLRARQRRFMLSAALSPPRTESASTPWPSGRACRRCTLTGILSRLEV
jgi:putative ABC transport system substrate-binding protein